MPATLEEDQKTLSEADEKAAEASKKREEFEEDLDAVEPQEAVREQTFWYEDEKGERQELTYYQRPLSYFGKLDFFAVLGRAVDQAMSEGLSFGSLTSSLGGGVQIEDFVQAVGKIASYAPDLLKEIYCIALQVPREERAFVQLLMVRPGEDGMSDKDGAEIMETFIDQNAQALKDFFDQQVKPLIAKVQTVFAKEDPASLKPSKRTRRTTAKPSAKS